jgi:hypothetical protein
VDRLCITRTLTAAGKPGHLGKVRASLALAACLALSACTDEPVGHGGLPGDHPQAIDAAPPDDASSPDATRDAPDDTGEPDAAEDAPSE